MPADIISEIGIFLFALIGFTKNLSGDKNDK